PQQSVAVEGDVDGPVKDALLLLDNPRLGFAKKVGIEVADSDGMAQTHLTFRFPAIKELPFERVQLTAAAKIENGRLGHVFLGHDLTEGNLDLKLNNQGIGVTGTAKLAEIPAGLRWDLHFDGADFVSRIVLDSNTSADDLARLGYDYREII